MIENNSGSASKLEELKAQALQAMHEVASMAKARINMACAEASDLRQRLEGLEQRCKTAEENSKSALMILNKIISEMEALIKEIDSNDGG